MYGTTVGSVYFVYRLSVYQGFFHFGFSFTKNSLRPLISRQEEIQWFFMLQVLMPRDPSPSRREKKFNGNQVGPTDDEAKKSTLPGSTGYKKPIHLLQLPRVRAGNYYFPPVSFPSTGVKRITWRALLNN